MRHLCFLLTLGASLLALDSAAAEANRVPAAGPRGETIEVVLPEARLDAQVGPTGNAPRPDLRLAALLPVPPHRGQFDALNWSVTTAGPMDAIPADDATGVGLLQLKALSQVGDEASSDSTLVIEGIIDPSELNDPERLARFPDPLHAHVDVYWANRFQETGRDYRPPIGVVGFSTPLETGCGLADPAVETAFYCVLDETIYYAVEFRQIIEENIGDYGWVVVVAHEWGHHVQRQLGYELAILPYQGGTTPPVALEQQADCLAGAYTDAAELSGWLDPGDVDEAILVTALSGDPPGTAAFNPSAHGNSGERVGAFEKGYQLGLDGCALGL